jgi:hypothetical protein
MPKLVYLVTEDWFFVSHFLPMTHVARGTELRVVIATRMDANGDRLAAQGPPVTWKEGTSRVKFRFAFKTS